MKFGKTIKIFLIDGDPNGRMSCELSNWTGKKLNKLSGLPSYAAAIVMGRSANGLTEWKTVEGVLLKNHESNI